MVRGRRVKRERVVRRWVGYIYYCGGWKLEMCVFESADLQVWVRLLLLLLWKAVRSNEQGKASTLNTLPHHKKKAPNVDFPVWFTS